MMERVLRLTALLALAGCAQSPCMQPDVLAFVDQARQSRDLYAIGMTDAQPRSTPMLRTRPASMSPVLDRRTVACTATMLSRNPAFQPGNGQARYLNERQDFKVVKLATGYEVSLYPP